MASIDDMQRQREKLAKERAALAARIADKRTLEELEAQMEKLEERRAALDEQIARKRKATAAEERKARERSLMVMGSLILDCTSHGNWKRIDWTALSEFFERHADEIDACEAEELGTAAAKKRLRKWDSDRKKSRDAAKQAEEAEEEEEGISEEAEEEQEIADDEEAEVVDEATEVVEPARAPERTPDGFGVFRRANRPPVSPF